MSIGAMLAHGFTDYMEWPFYGPFNLAELASTDKAVDYPSLPKVPLCAVRQ